MFQFLFSRKTAARIAAVILLVFSSLFLLLNDLAAQDKSANKSAATENKEDQANYLGVLDTGVGKLRLKLVVTTDKSGNKSAVMYSVDQGNAKMEFDEFDWQGNTVKFNAAQFFMKYVGTATDKNEKITGKFTQLEKSFDLDFKKVKAVAPDQHIQTWQGVLKAGTQEFDFQIRVYQTDQKKLIGKLDSFTEEIYDLPLEYEVQGNEVKFSLKITQATYDGKYSADKSQIVGVWNQRNGKFDLTFNTVPLDKTRKPAAGARKWNRPQTPKPPFSYKVADVTFENKNDKVNLAGTLTIPRAAGKYPAVILISGSGAQNRNGEIFGHKSFWVIADALTKAGVAVLRYDERGVGKSTGDIATANSLDLARDVEAGIEYLRSRSDIDPNRIGLIGHSEGGYIAPMIAARNDQVAFIVMMAGPGLPGQDIVISQTELILKNSGLPQEMIDAALNMSKQLFATLEKHRDDKDVLQKLNQTIDELVDATPEDQRKNFGDLKTARAGLVRMTSPWFKFFAFHDPRVDLRKVKCPVLAINGTKDLQVDPELCLPEIEKAFKEAGNKDVTIKRLENLNHLFQKTTTGNIAEYARLEETFNAAALKTVVDWVVEKSKKND